MAEQLSGCEPAKFFDEPVKTIVGCLAELVPEGPGRTLLYVVVGLCAALAPFIYRYYLGVLAQGAKPEGSIERQDYGRLRASLEGGNLAARLYAKWLRAFLDGVDKFFEGKEPKAHRTLFPHAFGLKTPAPLWTASAFDRCLSLALIYPIATIFLIWAISGHVGPAEAALLLKSGLPAWLRAAMVTASSLLGFSFWQVRNQMIAGIGRPYFALSCVLANLILVGVIIYVEPDLGLAIGTVNCGVIALTTLDVTRTTFDDRFSAKIVTGFSTIIVTALLVAFPLIFVSISFSSGVVSRVSFLFLALIVGFSIVIAVFYLSLTALEHRRHGLFLVLIYLSAVLTCFVEAGLLSRLDSWVVAGPFLLFTALLLLLNAPFDWASLGVTRALLRRGLERENVWWPYGYACFDALFATGFVALLALTMVIGVQAFDELAVHSGGEKAAVLPLPALFDGIAKNPGAPEYWWAYALLLSTMIPSLINLAIGGMAFTRGIPGVSRLLLNWTPEGRDVPDYKRQLTAIGLTVQMFAGAFLGIAAQALLAWGFIFHLMPAIGLDLLDMARAVAAFDFPARVAKLFASFL
jgi:hypothetical protein